MDQLIQVTDIDVDKKNKVAAEFDKSWELLERRSETVFTGSVYFPKYGKDESETQRGNLAIDNLVKELKGGFKSVFLVSHKAEEGDLYINELTKRMQAENLNADNLRLYKKNIEGYGESRREVMKLAVAEFSPKVVSLQEAEKDLTPFADDLIKPLFEQGAGIVTMKRGDALKSLPHYQKMGEAIQESLIHGMLEDALIQVGNRPEDVLNGTRFILNEPVATKYGRDVKPIDLFTGLDFAYTSESKDEVEGKYVFGIEKYSSSVYFPLVIARELGIKTDEVEVPYTHDQEQTKLEDREEERFREKRINQMKDIVAQHFDLVASMLKYKEEGKWPQVLWESMDEHKPLEIKHYEMSEWRIEEGKVTRKDETIQ